MRPINVVEGVEETVVGVVIIVDKTVVVVVVGEIVIDMFIVGCVVEVVDENVVVRVVGVDIVDDTKNNTRKNMIL